MKTPLFVRRFVDWSLFYGLRHPRTWIELAVFAVSLACIVIDWNFSTSVDGFLTIFGIVTGLISAYFFAADYRDWRKTRRDILFLPAANFIDDVLELTLPVGWSSERAGEGAVAWSPEVNALIDTCVVPLDVQRTRYRVPAPIAKYVEHAVSWKKPTMNEHKVRLLSDIDVAELRSGRPLAVEETEYALSVATNELAGSEVFSFDNTRRKAEEKRYKEASILTEYVQRAGALISLGQSELSNHIGVTTLVVTSDARLALQWQRDTQHDKNLMNAGGSGSVDWADVDGAAAAHLRTTIDLATLVKFAMLREAQEEINAGRPFRNPQIALTGYARYLHRGGKPEFFGLCRIADPFSALQARPHGPEARWVRSVEMRPLNGTADVNILAAIEAYLAEVDYAQPPLAAISLITALRFGRDYLRRRVT